MARDTLEAVLDRIAAENEVTTISVGRMVVGGRIVRTATVHYEGHAADGVPCDSGHSDTSIREALHKAIKNAAANRTPRAIVPVELPALEMTAA